MTTIKRRLKTLNTPFELFKSYCYMIQDKLVGYKIPRLVHNYEKFFRVQKGDVVIDVGAHIGLFTILVAKRASRVVAIEPEPKNLRCLLHNIRLRKLSNVLVVEKAVWDCRRKLLLYLGLSSSGHSLIRDVKVLNKSHITNCKITVNADTLDSIVMNLRLPLVDFIKMDIEGAEIEALEGAKETLRRTSKIVVASYHQRNGLKTSAGIARILIEKGFRVYIEDDIIYGARNRTAHRKVCVD
ncbi:MAG: FkbM family methyltransferase [Candidatus Bathyarchaeota archaeon]|nr:FkbM family methyltransferase [Candidatus Bathyarchaeota archaeon]